MRTWRQEALAENYREVAALGRELYERIGVLARHFDDLRRRLDGAVQAYNSAAASFEARAAWGPQAPRPERHDGRGAPGGRADRHGPRTLKQAGLLELEEAASDPEIT